MYLVRGREYLAQYPNFTLVGREHDLERISSILIRKSSNSLLLTGPQRCFNAYPWFIGG